MIKDEKLSVVFPWIELIPFGLYKIVALYMSTPANALYKKGLQVIQDIGVYVIPVALIMGIALAVTGFAVFRRLHGWRRTTTLVLSICHIAVFAVAACGMAVFVFLVLTGKITN